MLAIAGKWAPNLHPSQQVWRLSLVLQILPLLLSQKQARKGEITPTVSTEPILVPQQHICDFDRVPLRSIVSSQTFPDILLVNAFDFVSELVDDILLNTTEAFDDLKIEVRWVNQGGKLSENGSGRRGKRGKVARKIGCEKRVLENLWYRNSFHRVNGEHPLDQCTGIW